MAAAAEIGWPVVVKTATSGVAHKSDVDGVRLGIRDEPELVLAYADLASRLGPDVTVAETAPAGVELALGMVRDPQFGPLVLVAAGGVLVEVLRDRRTALVPVDEVRARRLFDGWRSGRCWTACAGRRRPTSPPSPARSSGSRCSRRTSATSSTRWT